MKMIRFTVDIYENTEGHLDGLFEIKSSEYIMDYARDFKSNPNFHGMQSNYCGDDERWQKQIDLLDEIAKKFMALISIK
jgi:hypothetical protein